jgi:hypothetical protein
MLRGTRRICLLDLIAAHPSGSINRLARIKIRNHRIDEVRILQEHRRPGIHAFHVEHTDHDGRDGIARDTNHERGNPGATERRVISGCGVNNSLDMASAEFFRLPREFLRYCVGNPSCDVGTSARQGPDQHADGRAANEIEPIALPDIPDADENIANLLSQYRPALVDCNDATHQLGDSEHPDHCRNKTDALQEFDTAERESWIPGGRINAA